MKKLFTFFLALVAGVSAIYTSDTEVDGIWYDFDESNKTATVTYRGVFSDRYSDEYSGSVLIPSSVTYNGTSYSVTSIGYGAFRDCSSLTSVTIPNSVTSIGVDAFDGCSSLTSINVDAYNSKYSSADGVLFNKDKTTLIAYPGGKQGAYTIPNGVTSIGHFAFSYCSSLTSVTIPNSVTSIGEGAFVRCSSLTSITIPNSVTSIVVGAFYECSSLTSINVAAYNSKYSSVDGVLFNKDKTTVITYPEGKQGAYTIPNSVTSIGEGTFGNCSSLTSVTIPNSVTSIGGGAFAGCSSLTSINIPNSVTSIGDYTFSECSSLTSMTIGESVTSIGDEAFYGCNKLVDVYCYATTPPATEGEKTFSHYNAFLYVPCESKKAYMVDAVWGNFKYIECISSEGIEDVQSDEVQSTKVIKDGQIYILRNGKMYTMQGVEVK